MKLELPIAVSLLAAGCFVAWNARNGTKPNRIEQTSDKAVIQTSYQLPTVGQEINADARDLIQSTAQQLQNAGPLMADVKMSVDMFGQHIRSVGRYYQMGQGTRKSRLEFSFDSDESQAKILQVCDGHFYYRYQAFGEKASLDIADLARVAEADRSVLLADSKTWMSTGGLSSLLSALAGNFDFQPVRQISKGQSSGFVIAGRWNEVRLRHLLYGQINQNFIHNSIQWKRLPAHIPQSVEIHLRQSASGSVFPSRITFICHQSESSESVDSISLEFASPKMVQELPEETFRVRAGSVEMNDLTNEFVGRVEDLQQAVRQAAMSGDTFFK